MSTQTFALPDVGEGLTEADILTWRVAVGDEVAVNQILVEVETAKAAVELPCPYDGVVAELLAREGETVAVGAALVRVATGAEDGTRSPEHSAGDGPGETPGDGSGASAEETSGEQPGESSGGTSGSVLVGYGTSSAGTTRRPRRRAGSGPTRSGSQRSPADPRPRATPPVRKLAKDAGVDLSEVAHDGDRVRREDLQRHLESSGALDASRDRVPPQPVTPEPVTPEPGPAEPLDAEPAAGEPTSPDERRVPIHGVRKATAAAMTSSAFTAPHVTEFLTVDVTAMTETVERLKAHPAFAEVRVTPLLLVARALLSAVRHHPDVNARWDEDNQEIVHQRRVNLGIAAATPRGLIVPNIKDAASLTLVDLARSLAELTTTARAGRTTPEQMSGGTITITNVGVFGVDAATPILNPGEAAILCFGAVRRLPWEYRGEIALREITQLSLSFDHRLVDGELGSRVLARVGAVLADPATELLLD